MRNWIVNIAAFFAVACSGGGGDISVQSDPGADRIAALWDVTIAKYLQDPLWTATEAYDAGHALMLPLHFAFAADRPELQAQFSSHFSRLDENWDMLAENKITRFQYLYLLSRYLNLASIAATDDPTNESLINRLLEEVRHQWYEAEFWQWEREPFTGLGARVAWKLSQGETDPSFHRGITDEALYLFAIAADLYSVQESWPQIAAQDAMLMEIVEAAYATLTTRVVFTQSGGWIFQPGIWTDHRDFAYAGHLEESTNLEPLKVEGIAEDSAHSHRMALWLISLEAATVVNRPEFSGWFRSLRNALAVQFLSTILVYPDAQFPGFRLTNYMDGHNGLYRWGAANQGTNNGYGPYELSGFIVFGWWDFLENEDVQNLFVRQKELFPLADDVLATYVGPNTTRTRNELMVQPDFYTNGFAELLVRIAAE